MLTEPKLLTRDELVAFAERARLHGPAGADSALAVLALHVAALTPDGDGTEFDELDDAAMHVKLTMMYGRGKARHAAVECLLRVADGALTRADEADRDRAAIDSTLDDVVSVLRFEGETDSPSELAVKRMAEAEALEEERDTAHARIAVMEERFTAILCAESEMQELFARTDGGRASTESERTAAGLKLTQAITETRRLRAKGWRQ